ncbi:MAG: enoyl-CoA hydratase/isomerase family protein [Desulfobacterota bacterium]|nr:enoyl-CoA hydratase/isomerase family protein [Thermodesulfobacteriota bacterium]
MGLIEYRLDENVAVVTMNSGENRFTYDFLQAFMDLLAEIEQQTRATVLLVHSAHEKIWSNGIDLEWLLAETGRNPEAGQRFPERIMALLRRLLTYPLTTVAAINGHAFAGGAIMACAFDFRLMRSDRGYFCFPEVDIQIPFLPGMDALLKKALPNTLVLEAQLTGRRYTAADLESRGVVLKACPAGDLLPAALTFAKTQHKTREVLQTMKEVTFRDILRVMETADPVYLKSLKGGLVR